MDKPRRNVRLREAMIPLLLTHSDLDAAARRAIDGLPDEARYRARLRYVAAATLQRMWWTRLTQDLGPLPRITPAYLDELRLPPLERDFGEATLLALSNQEEARFGHDAWIGYTSLMDLFLAQIAVDRSWGKLTARAPKAGQKQPDPNRKVAAAGRSPGPIQVHARAG